MATSVASIALVKDEADIIEFTLRRMAQHVDWMIVADNGSTDETREILDELARTLPLTVLDDPDPAHYQSRKVTALAASAARMGADWVIAHDADEVWYSPFGQVADVLEELDAAIVAAPIYNHRATAKDPADPSPLMQMGWREQHRLPLHKVACRTVIPVHIAEGNHHAHYPAPTVYGDLVVRHFPYRSAEQFVRKVRNGAAALAATDLPEDIGKHWRDYGRLGDEQLGDVFRKHFWTLDPATDPDLIFDPVP
jgi:glycosyltransferase involved in cell wall biosynthesis